MTRLVFDTETNGLLQQVTKMHLMVTVDADTDELRDYADQPGHVAIERGLEALYDADELIGHNIIKYDLPVLEKLYDFRPKPTTKITDTLVLSRVKHADLRDEDFRLRQKNSYFPGYYVGSHSLEAWGFRLGELKDEYGVLPNGKPDPDAWVSWNPTMHKYGKQDGIVGKKLWRHLTKNPIAEGCEWIEHRFAQIISMMERRGFGFDREAATKLYQELVKKRLEISSQLREVFQPLEVRTAFIPKVNNKAKGWVKGVPAEKVKVVEFNPSSRQMIADRLKARGWKPLEFTPSGQPKIDEGILATLDFPEAKVLSEHFLIEKRIGQIAEGDQAWLRLERDGRIHASVNTNGAVTGRCTHSHPNIAQVPKVGSPYGEECRACFVAKPLLNTTSRTVLVGIDLAGVELRCLSHYMARYDDGAYGKAVVEGSSKDGTDVHSLNAKALGLDPHKLYTVFGKQAKGRDIAKTFIYAFLYGAGDEKLGSIVGVSEEEIIWLREHQGRRWSQAVARLARDERAFDPVVVATIVKGGLLKARFLKNTPALERLREDVITKAKEKKYLVGLDGRILSIRSSHSALNTLLQSAGAILAKAATIIAYDDLSTDGYQWGTDWALVAHIHDELQNEAREEIADEVGCTVVKAMRKAGERYKLRVPIDGEYKIGRDWAETH